MSDDTRSSKELHFNELAPDDTEALALLAEECAEVIQIICKIQRHGLWSCHPVTQKQNFGLLQQEVGDLMAALRIAETQNLLRWGDVIKNRDAKLIRVQKYLHHAKVTTDE